MEEIRRIYEFRVHFYSDEVFGQSGNVAWTFLNVRSLNTLFFVFFSIDSSSYTYVFLLRKHFFCAFRLPESTTFNSFLLHIFKWCVEERKKSMAVGGSKETVRWGQASANHSKMSSNALSHRCQIVVQQRTPPRSISCSMQSWNGFRIASQSPVVISNANSTQSRR